MTKNVGTVDRIIRLIIGVVLILAPFVSGMAMFENAVVTVIAIIVGLVMLVTSAMNFCPLYQITGLRTRND